MDWKQLRKLHKIMCNGETVLINTFTKSPQLLIVKCYKYLCRQFAIVEIHIVFIFSPMIAIGLFCCLNSTIIYYYELILK